MSTYERCKLNVIAEREFVAPEHGPLKRLNKRAINIADSHEGDKATTLSGTGSETEALLWLSMEKEVD